MDHEGLSSNPKRPCKMGMVECTVIPGLRAETGASQGLGGQPVQSDCSAPGPMRNSVSKNKWTVVEEDSLCQHWPLQEHTHTHVNRQAKIIKLKALIMKKLYEFASACKF